MNRNLTIGFLILAIFVLFATDIFAQRKKKSTRKTKPPVATAAPATTTTEPTVVSRAEDYTVEQPQTTGAPVEDVNDRLANADRRIQELVDRIKGLEDDQKQKRLLLNLDILARAEQRSESLRKQQLELIDRELALQAKLDQIDSDIRPENIERGVALAGTLRPEELREARRKNLDAERKSIEAILAEIQNRKVSLEQSVQRADALVEKLRTKLEREIDAALADDKP